VRTIKIIQRQAPSAGEPPQPSPGLELSVELRRHFELCQEVLSLIEKENRLLRGPEAPDLKPLGTTRKNLLPRLTASINRLRQQRLLWQQLEPAQRARHPEISAWLRQNQDLTMKIIMLDRENEQLLLRRGLLPPNQLPPVQRQQGHFVSELYRRQIGKPS
jgi:hypothetical protein